MVEQRYNQNVLYAVGENQDLWKNKDWTDY